MIPSGREMRIRYLERLVPRLRRALDRDEEKAKGLRQKMMALHQAAFAEAAAAQAVHQCGPDTDGVTIYRIPLKDLVLHFTYWYAPVTVPLPDPVLNTISIPLVYTASPGALWSSATLSFLGVPFYCGNAGNHSFQFKCVFVDGTHSRPQIIHTFSLAGARGAYMTGGYSESPFHVDATVTDTCVQSFSRPDKFTDYSYSVDEA